MPSTPFQHRLHRLPMPPNDSSALPPVHVTTVPLPSSLTAQSVFNTGALASYVVLVARDFRVPTVPTRLVRLL
jgi:hypothetical protein